MGGVRAPTVHAVADPFAGMSTTPPVDRLCGGTREVFDGFCKIKNRGTTRVTVRFPGASGQSSGAGGVSRGNTVEVDRPQLYVVNDPDDLLQYAPLVAWFRVRGPPSNEVFTFSLVNTRVDPSRPLPELNKLDDVYRAVLRDGRQEDDVLLLGDFGADDKNLGELGSMADLYAVISQVPSNTERTQQLDNVLFEHRSTREFTGQGGCFDFLREYNLSMQEALEVSTHLPVWAEFSIYEGGTPGKVAGKNQPLR